MRLSRLNMEVISVIYYVAKIDMKFDLVVNILWCLNTGVLYGSKDFQGIQGK